MDREAAGDAVAAGCLGLAASLASGPCPSSLSLVLLSLFPWERWLGLCVYGPFQLCDLGILCTSCCRQSFGTLFSDRPALPEDFCVVLFLRQDPPRWECLHLDLSGCPAGLDAFPSLAPDFCLTFLERRFSLHTPAARYRLGAALPCPPVSTAKLPFRPADCR